MAILEHIARVTARSPDAVAVEDPEARLTYAELDARSNAIANRLGARGIGPERLVGICTRPSVETVVAMLGVLKAGAAFVALDITYPAKRLAAMIEDSALGVVVVDAARHRAPELSGLESILIDLAAEPLARPTKLDPAQLAYVVFTSGSTGRPKGVAVTHAGLVNLAKQQIEAFQIGASSRVLQFAPLGFDAVVSEAFTALCAGATLCLEERRPGHDIGELLARRAITVVTMPPSLLRVLSPDGLPVLRTVVSAGEACSAEIVARWAKGRLLLNAYGPSECTVCATMKRMAGPTDTPTIGRAIEGVATFVLDENLQPCDTGELYLGGEALARGYLGKAELTAARFVPDPFSRGGRLYRTGDLVRLGIGGELEFLGRTDDQVKIRGFRVEPREVEDALRELPGVDDVVVLTRTRATGEVVLVAYVLSRSVGNRELRSFATIRLPAFLRPSEYELVTEWPLSPNGKVDRAALRGRSRMATAPAAMANSATERELERIVCALLECSRVDFDRSFFDQGGDSIAAARLVIAISAAFHRQFSIGRLFDAETLRALADRIDEVAVTEAQPAIVVLRDGRLPVWMLAPVHGNAVCYLRLANLISADVRCCGLQTPGVDGEMAPIDDFVALAAHQIKTLRRHQPKGPYALVGWSMGGSLAFEMAVQLEQAGEVVSHLGLIGATTPSPKHLEGARATMKEYESWRIAYFYLRSLAFSLGLRLPLDFDAFSKLPHDQVFSRFISVVRTLGPLGADIDDELATRWLGVVRSNLYAFHHHVPSGTFHGRALTVHATGANPLLEDDLLRSGPVPFESWDDYLAGPVDTRSVAANHYTLMQDPWVGELAGIIGDWLRPRLK